MVEDFFHQKTNAYLLIEHSSSKYFLEAGRIRDLLHHELVWMLKGTSVVVKDGSENVLESDSIYFLKPGKLSTVQFDPHCECTVITISNDLLNMMQKMDDLPLLMDYYGGKLTLPDFSIVHIHQKVMRELVEKMIAEFSHHREWRVEEVKPIFRLFLIHFSIGMNGGAGACLR